MVKNTYSIQSIQGKLFFRGSATCSKFLHRKKVYSIQRKFQRKLFQEKRMLLKNPERWKYFHYSVFSVYLFGGDPCNLR